MAQSSGQLSIPKVSTEIVIDGDIAEWKELAFTDGAWGLDRVKSSAWYNPKRNRLTIEDGEDTNTIDLSSNYYMAWDDQYLYLGAEVVDNINDVEETKHEPKRWYYKDAIAWFFEVPKDSVGEKFELGNHAFAFVLDTTKPDYGSWWRHGSAEQSYVEEAIPGQAHKYELKFSSSNNGRLQYTLEARIDLALTIGHVDSQWPGFQVGDLIGGMIVHCDPDGGEYGGHLLIYGKGDNDETWSTFELVGE